MFAVSTCRRDIPDALIEAHSLKPARRHEGADEEVVFSDRRQPRELPVWMNGQLMVLPWGSWAEVDEVRRGEWIHSVPVLVPANLVCDSGVWFAVTQGLKAVARAGVVHLIHQPATHYYEVMTRNKRMPVFEGETI